MLYFEKNKNGIYELKKIRRWQLFISYIVSHIDHVTILDFDIFSPDLLTYWDYRNNRD